MTLLASQIVDANYRLKINVLSDLHCEVSDFCAQENDADVIVLAGDIFSHRSLDPINFIINTFGEAKPIIYVPGNHEYYYTYRDLMRAELFDRALNFDCLHILDNNQVVIDGVRFLGATLWTDFLLYGEGSRPWDMHTAQMQLSDFRGAIDERVGVPFTPQISSELHTTSVSWLKAKLQEHFDGKTVVVTHHLPSMRSVPDRFKANPLTACFASNLDFMLGGGVDLWIHGHTHDSCDYTANGTRVVCNPRGYVTYRGPENLEFNPRLVVEV